jgi:hypothetical protein
MTSSTKAGGSRHSRPTTVRCRSSDRCVSRVSVVLKPDQFVVVDT